LLLAVLLQVLVICPTQELCMQVLRAARDLLPRNRNKVQPLVGKQNSSMVRCKPDHLRDNHGSEMHLTT
jgi:superfamily II DNA/RNA helicase